MPIKYGELTIIYNKEEISIFTDLLLWLNYEENPPNKSNYVFLFDDGEVCDSDKNFKDLKYEFFNSTLSAMPRYFQKQKTHKDSRKNIHFYKNPAIDKNNIHSLNFNKIFSSYSKYDHKIITASKYNSIYYCYKSASQPETFGLIRIKSNGYMPRFLFAYDTDEFTKEEIVYLIYSVFTGTENKCV